jgi:hypothetical protein
MDTVQWEDYVMVMVVMIMMIVMMAKRMMNFEEHNSELNDCLSWS